MKALHFLITSSIIILTVSCITPEKTNFNQDLAQKILTDSSLLEVEKRAHELIATGFNAGTVYQEVWIRDYNTFIEISCKVLPIDQVKENLLTFFKFQEADGNIIDGFVPIDQASVGYKYRYTPLAPQFAGHKNTVETDQESSLVQAVSKYIQQTGERDFLNIEIDGHPVLDRLDLAMQYLIDHRFDLKNGLLWGATTVDWGDVQPEHPWGVELDENSHLCIDIYDNAMFKIALDHLIDFLPDGARKTYWLNQRNQIVDQIRLVLWDEANSKFIPHIYLDDSPFPAEFDENELHYHGGTAIAIEAGLLTPDEIARVNAQMLENVKESGAPSIGLTVYPPYPQGYFQNKGMYPYGYQNGGDWTWFGARMIRELARNGFIEEAYAELKPMVNRVIENKGFYEWYTKDGQPTGAGKFRGSAGVLATAIAELRSWAESQ